MGTGDSILSREGQVRDQISVSLPRSVTEKYEVLDTVGKGAFGTVYKVRDTRTKIVYAIKQMEYNENNLKEASVNFKLSRSPPNGAVFLGRDSSWVKR